MDELLDVGSQIFASDIVVGLSAGVWYAHAKPYIEGEVGNVEFEDHEVSNIAKIVFTLSIVTNISNLVESVLPHVVMRVLKDVDQMIGYSL